MVRDSDVPRIPKVGAKNYARGRSFYARLTRRDFLFNLEKRRPLLNLTIRTPEWQEQSWERGTGPATRILVRTLWQRPQCHSSITLPLAVAKLAVIRCQVYRRHRPSQHASSDEREYLSILMAMQRQPLRQTVVMVMSTIHCKGGMLWRRSGLRPPLHVD